MIDTIGALIATLAMLLAIVLNPPHRAHCPRGFVLNTGIRRSGAFQCTRVPVGGDHRDSRGIIIDDSFVPPGEVDGWIYCTNGQEPIVVDARTVGCQQRH